MSTLDISLAHRYAREGWSVEELEIEVITLESILQQHATPGFDLLKIDVEGREGDVLASFDLEHWRPRALVIEAVVPGTPIPSHHSWESVVLKAGYRLALFDGLNRFYSTVDDEVLHERLSVPANIFDRFIPARFVGCISQRHAKT